MKLPVPAVEAALRKSGALLVLSLAAFAARANDIDPFGFEKEHFITSKTRAEVVADVKAARADGVLPVPGELGVRPAEVASVKTRAQVAAETREAARLGLIVYGEAAPKTPTPEQQHQIELAGMRAAASATAAARAGRRSGG